jgi:hypothetical protein
VGTLYRNATSIPQSVLKEVDEEHGSADPALRGRQVLS